MPIYLEHTSLTPEEEQRLRTTRRLKSAIESIMLHTGLSLNEATEYAADEIEESLMTKYTHQLDTMDRMTDNRTVRHAMNPAYKER